MRLSYCPLTTPLPPPHTHTGAYLHAHIEVAAHCHGQPAKLAILREAVTPAIDAASLRFEEHRLQFWSLSTLQVNLLTARAAIDAKRRAVKELAHGGELTHADEAALVTALDSAMAEVDAIRYSVLAPRRFHRKLKKVLTELASAERDSAVGLGPRPGSAPHQVATSPIDERA
ncbi:hypothetical protein T492DRAFT_426073 [Pavlovales sp. CCMP2436]|nr:hypothetical protein T492DRAFT_426073 [Pavlovales sp. CCMP2436]